MIISIVGNVRTGKTLLMSILLWFLARHNKSVYTNYELDGSTKIEPYDLFGMSLSKGWLGLDEVYAWLESRFSSSSKVQVCESLFIFQSGKMGIHIIYTAQLDSTVDKRLRELADLRFVAEKDEVEGVFRYTRIDSEGNELDDGFEIPIAFAALFYGKYNTYEKVLPAQYKDLLAEMCRTSTDKLNEYVNRQVALLLLAVNVSRFGFHVRSSKDEVTNALVELGEPPLYANLVVIRLRRALLAARMSGGF